ncbi:hypothetical protein [Streptomyces cyslabdanicus]|uniref:hypothetical protein n=1 Tax=Streptomyces cyslabdanicus TaxID=1470456 RepID=UPI0040441C43
MTSVRYRKRPVEVDTIQWTGDNEAQVQAFTGPQNFYALDDADRANSDDPEATATVYDRLHSTWMLVYTGQHIVRGVKGEFYPIAEDVLAETYEPVLVDPVSTVAAVGMPVTTGLTGEASGPELPPAPTEAEQLRDTLRTLETIVNRVREAVGTSEPAPAAPADDAQRTARRASIRNLLDRAGRGILIGGTEGELLRQQVEAEMRLSDQRVAQAEERAEGRAQAAEQRADIYQAAWHSARDRAHKATKRTRHDAETYETQTAALRRQLARAEQAEAAAERVRTLLPDAPVDDFLAAGIRPADLRAALDGTEQPPSPTPTDAAEPEPSPLREQLAEALARSEGWAWDPEHGSPSAANIHRYRKLAGAAVAAILPTTKLLGALHESAEQDVTRVIDLYERWCKAGPPPLGISLSRWWDERLVELRHAVVVEPAERPSDPS